MIEYPDEVVPLREKVWDVCVLISAGDNQQTVSALSFLREEDARDFAAVLALRDAVIESRVAQHLMGVDDNDLETRESLSLEYLGLFRRETLRTRLEDPKPEEKDVKRLFALLGCK